MSEDRASARRLARRVKPAEAGRTVAELVGEWAGELLGCEVPRARARALVAAGAVRVDGVVVRAPARPLRPGQRIDALLRAPELRAATARTDRPFVLGPTSVLFEDEWLLAVDKPPGLPTHATADHRRPSLVGHVEQYLRAAGRKARVSVHQRLDRDTSGVVLFAIDPAANAPLAHAFEARSVAKTYLALAALASPPPVAFPLVTSRPISTDASGRVRVGASGGAPAETELRIVERLGPVALVEACPRTGRKHQVRAHLADLGLPILGDAVYGGPTQAAGLPVPRLMLHARRLSLRNPRDGRRLEIVSPLPADFTALLEQARSRAGASR